MLDNEATQVEEVQNNELEKQDEPSLDDALSSKFKELTAPVEEKEPEKEEVKKDEEPDKIPDIEAKKAPSSWRANVREHFNALPPEVQDEILRREGDIHKGIEGYKQDAEYGRGLKNVLSQYENDFSQFGVTAPQAVQNLLQTEKTLRTGTPDQKLAIISSLVQDYGIPIEALVSDDGQVRDTAKQQSALMSRISQLEQQLHGQASQQRQVVDRETSDIISRFASDPANVYFEDVREEMGRLLSNGLANDIKEAYEKATWSRSDIRAVILTQQQKEAEAQRQKDNAAKVAQAKKAAGTTLKTSGVTPNANGNVSLDDDLRAVYRKLNS